MAAKLALLLVAITAPLAVGEKGILELDSWTFDKIVDGSRNVLVKFDKSYAYGEKEDAWKAAAKAIEDKPGALLAVVGVQDYGDKLNDDLRERFGVSADDFPVFKLFKKGEKIPVAYTADVTEDALKLFLKNEAGVYLGLKGCLEAFDKLAEKFMASDNAGRPGVQAEAEAALAALEDDSEKKSAKFYIKVMKRIVEKGEDYVVTETARLKRLIDSGISEGKKDEFKQRLNILPSFPKAAKEEL